MKLSISGPLLRALVIAGTLAHLSLLPVAAQEGTPQAVAETPPVPAQPAPAPAPTAAAPSSSPAPAPSQPLEAAPPLPPARQPAAPAARSAAAASDDTEYQNVRVQLSGNQETQSIADPFRVQVKVVNRTGDEIVVSKVRWELPRSIVATRPAEAQTSSSTAVPWSQGLTIADNEPLPNGGERLFDLIMPEMHDTWWQLPRNIRLLSFKPGDYPVKVRVEYAAGPRHRTSVAEESIRTRFDATPWFYIWGGIIGSMVGVLFEFFYTSARRLDRFEWPRDEHGRLAPGRAIRNAIAFLFRWILGGTAKWLTGSLTAAIVLLFLYYYKDVQLPITIQINDFFGAVVVGLVAHRLGLWVYETLFARGEKPPASGPGTPAAPEPFRFPQQVIPALTYPERQ